mmetsp:Transcript_7384/g.14662  ORF Transcript_7384/g.14662 Transcript_7384/m.14662 type:complete len:85 (-) Transcript_7384:62-316(-)
MPGLLGTNNALNCLQTTWICDCKPTLQAREYWVVVKQWQVLMDANPDIKIHSCTSCTPASHPCNLSLQACANGLTTVIDRIPRL